MENAIWIDLGLIGHKSTSLTELFRSEYLVDVPICNETTENESIDKFVVFFDYKIGVTGESGTKVFTNAFETPCKFYQSFTNKLISRYVEVNKSLDFEQNF